MKITQAMREWLVKNMAMRPDADDATAQKLAGVALQAGTLDSKTLGELQGATGDARATAIAQISEAVAQRLGGGAAINPTRGYSAMALLHGGAANPGGNVGGVSTTKSVGRHFKTGQPVLREDGQAVLTFSPFDLLKTGVYFKWLAAKGGFCSFGKSDERDILEDHIWKSPWVGDLGRDYGRFQGSDVKALIADSVSGGGFIVPEFLDDLWLVPLLTGELFPQVDVKEVPYGNSVIGGTVNSPTVAWGVAEGTPQSVVSTAGIVGQIAASIHPVAVYMDVGRDLLDDSPAQLGATLVESISQRFGAELDRVIAAGDGVNEPTGLSVASGLTAVPSDNGSGGPPTVSDLEALIFGVGKQYRTSAMRPGFVMSDTSYGRCRGIAVGPNDERRVLGMDEQSYKMLEYPAHVCNALGNNVAIFGAMRSYRLWRRLGFSFRFETGGTTLAQRNCAMLVGRARVGGKPVDAAAFTKIEDWEA